MPLLPGANGLLLFLLSFCYQVAHYAHYGFEGKNEFSPPSRWPRLSGSKNDFITDHAGNGFKMGQAWEPAFKGTHAELQGR
jgi:hypothetical protein